jgi:hypothetical protein
LTIMNLELGGGIWFEKVRHGLHRPVEGRRSEGAVADGPHGLRLDVRGRCASGMQGGAWILGDPTGRLAVLKQQSAGSGPDIRRLAATVAHVREAGYQAAVATVLARLHRLADDLADPC